MRGRDVLGVLGVAVATMAFTLVLFGPWSIVASDETPPIKLRIAQPEFTSHGCVFALKTEKPDYQSGESPVVEIEAKNPTDATVEATVWLGLSAADVPSPMARTLAMPRPVWSKPYVVRLNAGETTTAKLDTAVKLAANQNVTITIGDKELAILAGEFPVRNGAAPVLAAPQAAVPPQTAAPHQAVIAEK